MDSESSTKFIGSLTKFLQSLCNGYVEFDDGVELIGHIYLSVDAGKSGKTLNYFLNEKVCKNDNSVTFISNSFHAQPEGKSKAASGKDEGRREDGDVSDSGDNTPRSTNAGTILSRPQAAFRSAASPNQNRTGVHIGTKRPGSPLKGPAPQRRAPTPPSRRLQSSGPRGTVGSPVSKTVPSSPSSSSQDNVPSPSPVRKSRNEVGQPTSNQSDNVNTDNESDIVPPNVLSINPTPEFASFLGSLTSDNQTSQDQSSPPDTKPDTDVTFIKEEFVSEPSSCAQTGSSGQHSGRSGEDNSGLYPVMLHQNTSVFPSTSAGYPAYQGGASATATSQPAFPGTSSSQSDPFNPVPGTSQDGADPSDDEVKMSEAQTDTSAVDFAALVSDNAATSAWLTQSTLSPVGSGSMLSVPATASLGKLTSECSGSRAAMTQSRENKSVVWEFSGRKTYPCTVCGMVFFTHGSCSRHKWTHQDRSQFRHACPHCPKKFYRKDYLTKHVRAIHSNVHEELAHFGKGLSDSPC